MSQILIGDVYMMNFSGRGSVQQGWRPAVVLQNIIGNAYSPNVIAIPLTSKLDKNKMPTHVYLKAKRYGLERDSVALCEQFATISKEDIDMNIGKITTLPNEVMMKLSTACTISVPVIGYLDDESILKLIRYIRQKNNISIGAIA